MFILILVFEVLLGRAEPYFVQLKTPERAWRAGPIEPGLKYIIGNCGMPTYEAIEKEHLLHCFHNFVPGWMNYGDTHEIASLIALRVLNLNFGEKDSGSPIESVKKGLKRNSETYKNKGATQNFTNFIEPEKEHVLSPLKCGNM